MEINSVWFKLMTDEKSEEIKARRLMAEKQSIRTPTSLANSSAPAPAPAPAVKAPGNRKASIGKVISESLKLVVNGTGLNAI